MEKEKITDGLDAVSELVASLVAQGHEVDSVLSILISGCFMVMDMEFWRKNDRVSFFCNVANKTEKFLEDQDLK